MDEWAKNPLSEYLKFYWKARNLKRAWKAHIIFSSETVMSYVSYDQTVSAE